MDLPNDNVEERPLEKPSTLEVPEYYGSSIHVSVGPYEVVVDVGRSDPGSGEAVPEFRQRMSLQFAWVYAGILQRLLDRYIRDNGPISLPKNVVEQLELTEQYERQLRLCREEQDE